MSSNGDGDIEVRLTAVVLMSLIGIAIAAPTCAAGDCADDAKAKESVQSFDADIVQFRDQQKAKESTVQARIEAATGALIKSGKRTEQDRSRFFAVQMNSDDFLAAENENKSQLSLFDLAAQTMVSNTSTGSFKGVCINANDMRALLATIGTINDKQFKKMLDDIQAFSHSP